MIIERTESEGFLTNAYLLADGPGGTGVLVDGNGVVDDLLARAERDGITVAHVLLTHHHGDHVMDLAAVAERLGAPVLASEECARLLDDELAVARTLADGEVVEAGDLRVRALLTPGHAAGHLAFQAGDDVLTGDVLFRGTVGGTRGPGHTTFADLQRSVLERLLTLPPETRLHPGHREPTTVGDELAQNPFVRLWREEDAPGDERVHVWEQDCVLELWGPDYDGGHKAQVRWEDGSRDVVGGSQVQRA